MNDFKKRGNLIVKIYQVSEALNIGDAVSNYVVQLDKILAEMNLNGGVYITNFSNVSKKYINKIAKPILKLPKLNKDDVLIFHHAIANDFCYEIPGIDCKKILIYHNITPPRFFHGISPELEAACERGLEQLKLLNKEFDICIADSEFNKEDLLSIGFDCPIYVCPVIIPFDDYSKVHDKNTFEKYNDDYVNVLFVGRVSPNKKIEDIIHAFAIYKKEFNIKSRLILVGSNGLTKYDTKLREYIDKLGVEDVLMTGSVKFEEILAFYKVADVFICMSEHEGFCVPLAEAMFFDVPIIAYKCSAIPFTLADSGVLLEKKDYVLAAGWIDRIVKNEELKEYILQMQRKRLGFFRYEKVSAIIKNILRKI